MAGTASIAQRIDGYIDGLFAGWNIYTTILTVLLVGYLISPLFLSTEPDVHPMLLERQASIARVTQSDTESAIHRNLAVPEGFPLRSGLNIKDPGAARWTAGRDGDLRDIWRQAITNIITGVNSGKSVISVHGKGDITKHNLEDLSKEINVIGKHVLKLKATRVAIYLPNSTEFLVSFFAAAFYGFTPILIAPGQPLETMLQLLRETRADALIVAAGTVPLEAISKFVPAFKSVISVVSKTSRQLDFLTDEASAQWHDIIKNGFGQTTADLPSSSQQNEPNMVSVWFNDVTEHKPSSYCVVEYSQKNIIAAIAAQLAALPRGHAFEPLDVVLPLESLTNTYPLAICLAALFSGASIAMTSIASSSADYDLAFQQGFSPSIVITSAQTMRKAYDNWMTNLRKGFFSKLNHYRKLRSLATGTFRTNSASPRLIYVSDKGVHSGVFYDSRQLADLRVFTGSRIIYALTTANVAGAIAQTNPLDYRAVRQDGRWSHFGAPVTAIEIKLVDLCETKCSNIHRVGDIVAMGPAVVGGSTNTEIEAMIRTDGTLTLSPLSPLCD